MGKLSYIRSCLHAVAMLPALCAATSHCQVPPGALVVSGYLAFGGSIYADSFDSSNPLFSTNGRYDRIKRKGNGDIRSASAFSTPGNSDIRGRVWAPSVVVSHSVCIGDLHWNGVGIQPGWLQPATPFQFEDASSPYSDAPQPSGGTLVIRGATNSFDGILGNGDYLLLTNTSLAITGVARLFAPNGFNGSISLAPGSRLNMYVGTSLGLTVVGTNAQADFATNLVIYCLPTVTNVKLFSGLLFTGILYAPEADVFLAGNVVVFGSIAAKSVTCGGTADFHYDEQISRWYAPMHPTLASARFVSGLGMQFEVWGSPGLNYVVETSTDLTDWIPSSTNASPFTYTDPQASLFPNRFYRALITDY